MRQPTTPVVFTTVKAVSDGDAGRKVESYELPVDGTSLRPVAGTYSSTPGITELQINGTAQSAFDPYKTHEEYIYVWNVGDAEEATLELTLNDGYSATYYGSTKTLYALTENDVEIGKFAVWYINGTVDISDADAVEDDFQLAFDDNDPSGTDIFLLSVSRGDYHNRSPLCLLRTAQDHHRRHRHDRLRGERDCRHWHVHDRLP